MCSKQRFATTKHAWPLLPQAHASAQRLPPAELALALQGCRCWRRQASATWLLPAQLVLLLQGDVRDGDVQLLGDRALHPVHEVAIALALCISLKTRGLIRSGPVAACHISDRKMACLQGMRCCAAHDMEQDKSILLDGSVQMDIKVAETGETITSLGRIAGSTVTSSSTHGAKQNQNMLAAKDDVSVCVEMPNTGAARTC